MLQHFGLIPYLVFDGDFLPGKAATEADRARRRDESRMLGLELLQRGRTAQAQQELQKAVDITPEMAARLIEELKKLGVQYLVAPYEADAQLVYLERKGVISAIISEDSDLLVFGAKCLLTKLDQYGDCIEVNRADFTACREISLVGWSDVEFRRMAILSGCDYLANVNKMGLKTAYRLVRKYKSLDRIVRSMQLDGRYIVPDGYLALVRQAEFTFLYQRVFCPLLNRVVMHNDLAPDVSEEQLSFIGQHVESEVASAVARGELHPVTKNLLVVDRVDDGHASARPRPSSNRLRAYASNGMDDLKTGVPIDKYFRLRRTPLAELDPNCFIPTTDQRRVLNQNANASWDLRMAPFRSTLSGPATTSPSTPVVHSSTSTLPSSSANPYRPTPRPTRIDRPSKRARLCSEAKAQERNIVALDSLGGISSRFFYTSDALPHNDVSLKNNSWKNAAGLFSDDSLDAALSTLPDDLHTVMKPKAKAKFKVFQDPATTEETERGVTLAQPKSGVDRCHAIEPHRRLGSENGTVVESSKTFNASAFLRQDSSKTTVQERIVFFDKSTPLSSVLSNAAEDQNYASDKWSSSSSRSKRTSQPAPATQVTTRPPAKVAMPARPSTPLQRIGVAALNRTNSTTTKMSSMATTTQGSQTSIAADSSFSEAIVTRDWTYKEHVTVSVQRRWSARGSEDLIVPDSEGETDEDGLQQHDEAALAVV